MEEKKKIVGREYLSSTKCDLDVDGYWKAVNIITDRVLYEGETEWVEETVNAMSVDQNCQNAIQTAMSSTLNYLVQSVYQNGFNGLVEFRAYEKQLKEAKSVQPQTTETNVL